MQQPIGAFIRQLRREQNMTQTELGGTAFSKSYISAVESDKLSPSREALKHFAVCLGRPERYFLTIANQIKVDTLVPLSEAAVVLGPETIGLLAHEKVALLEALFDQPEYTEVQTPESFFTLSTEILALLSLPDQAHYYFFQALTLQKKGEYSAAIESLEQALARESHPAHATAIQHEMGKCYLQMHLPQLALNYALRARRTVSRETAFVAASSLPFGIELSSGQICLALGWHQQALEYFERARACLNARQPMRHVGQLYWGLGYCIYALVYQQAYTSGEWNKRIDGQYQRALAYLVQSQNIAQMSGDRQEVKGRHLTQAMVQLDWSVGRRRSGGQGEKANRSAKGLWQASLLSVLEEVSEQCRQVLAGFQDEMVSGGNDVVKQKTFAYIALSLLIRVGVQRALLAREQGYESTFQRERSLANALCQQVLDACKEETLLETLVWNIGNLPEMSVVSSSATLPRLPDVSLWQGEEKVWPLCASQAEVYFAAGEVAEMLGRTSTTPDFIRSCYASADTSFLRALEGLRLSQARYQSDATYLTRAYQRYIALVEERLFVEVDQEQNACQAANSLLILCKQQLLVSQEDVFNRSLSVDQG